MKCFHLLFALSLLLGASLCHGASEPVSDKKNILYLNSYHDGYQWSDGILQGIRSQLDTSPYKIDLQIEYMDAKKYNVPAVVEGLLRLYQQKFHDKSFDVVMVSDDDAFTFALQYRDQLFPGVPVVFCGVNNLDQEDVRKGNLTGVVENFDLAGTIRVALELHPEVQRMVVVGDDSTAGRAIKKQIEELTPQFGDRLSIDYWIQLDLNEVQQRVKSLSADTFLFFIPYYQVIGNRFFTAEEVMQAIYQYSSVPIYTAWEFLLGSGAVGGSLLSGYRHGQEAAEMALSLLDGSVQAQNIPISHHPKSDYKFDYQVMQKLAISEKRLPTNSLVINLPNPFYELPRELFWTIVFSFFLLLITVIFLAINMVARKRVERRMQNQLTFQETLIDTIPQLVSWKDTEGKYVGANLTFANFFGLKEIAEVVNKTTRRITRDKSYVHWSNTADKAVVNGSNEFRKVRRKIVDAEGTESWLEVNKVPLRDQNDQISGILTTAENVTKEHNLEKQLLQSQKMEAIGNLAGGIAHDFNNILTSIVNSTELAIGDVAEDSQTAADLNRVLKAARRGGHVVRQILTFSKPTQEGFKSTDMAALISEVIHLMEVSLPGNIIMRSHISPGIEPIYADPTQIHQAIMNLYTNAFHELRERGGELNLRLEESFVDTLEAEYLNLPAGNYVKLTVEDNGQGIPADIIDKIFDPFFSLKDKAEGTGLGLSVVLGVVKAHNGGLRVKSTVEEGTSFEIFLPRIQKEEQEVESKVAISEDLGAEILFVEDELDQLDTVPRLLEERGFSVTAFGSAASALKVFKQEPNKYELLITDYDMPGMNGVELSKRISEIAPLLPIIILSGREEAVDAAAGLDMIKRVVMKPYQSNDFVGTIRHVLQERR